MIFSLFVFIYGQAQTQTIGLKAERLLDIENEKIVSPGEVLVRGEQIMEAGSKVTRPTEAEIIDLLDVTLMPGLIDRQSGKAHLD